MSQEPSREEVLSQVKEHWEELLNRGEILTFKAGQVVFYEGHQALGAYLICEGSIELFKSQDASFKREVIAGSQGILGMDFLLSGTAFEYSARAMSNAKICYLPKSEILKLLPSNDEMTKH